MAVTQIRGSTQVKDNTVTSGEVDSTIIIAAGSNAFSGDQSMGGNKLTNVGAPSTGNDAANKTYVDGLINGVKWKQSVKVATAAAGTLASDFDDGSTVDGVAIATGDRILIKDQADATENGIYVVAASGAPARASDADSGTELISAQVPVEQGTANADKIFTCTNNAITLGATNIVFTSMPSVAGALLAANNLSDLASASTARTNLGLAIGTHVQAYDAELAAIAGLTSAADKGIQFTGSGTAATYDLTAAGKALLDDADASAQRTTLGLAIGTNVQAYDATLAAFAALTIAANSLTIGTGADAFSQVTFAANKFPARASTGDLEAKTISDFALTLLDDADAAAMRTTLGVVGGTNVYRETPTGTVNGTNDDFVLAETPVSGTEMVYVNGILQDAGSGNDYQITDDTITFEAGAIPQSGDKLRVSYVF